MIRRWDFNVTGEILLVEKPLGWTSFDVVRKIRTLFHVRKIGHAGTLDPRATGLLVVCTGPKTKLIDSFVGYDKEYNGTFELGITTPSFDLETPVSERRSFDHLRSDDILKVAASFVGSSEQQPPMYSAVKVRGRALYKYAREGKDVKRLPRPIVIDRFEIGELSFPSVSFNLVCSKGTYVRALVHELGERLAVGATLTSLRRVRVGPWKLEDAWTIDRLTEIHQDEQSIHVTTDDLHAAS